MSNTKNARSPKASKNKRARKRKSTLDSRITRATSSRDRFKRLAANLTPTSDAAYLRDEAILTTALGEFSLDERMAMDPYKVASIAISAGGPNFQAEALPLLCRALRKRTERLSALLNDIRGDWVFASPLSFGKLPYWPDMLLRRHILPAAKRLGILKRIGWHTFRRTAASLLMSSGSSVKTTQELLRHATANITLALYAQAVTEDKRQAQEALAALITGPTIPPMNAAETGVAA